ncbi:MAG TPA: disulfide bond formation protein B [Lacipirellulaceae bacterium]|nr:disulfide bond formation protein B [Lacipirellulaceae bacterium]
MTDILKAESTRAWTLLFTAWLVALGCTLSALFIGEVLGQAPCVLCWYQRIAMFPLAIILGIACLRADFKVHYYAVPLALVGTAIAIWHSGLPQGIEPCGQGPSCASDDMTIFGGVPLPVISAGAFILIVGLIFFANEGAADE